MFGELFNIHDYVVYRCVMVPDKQVNNFPKIIDTNETEVTANLTMPIASPLSFIEYN